MKNNKGYYSWIHSMKSAAMQSHFNGQKMLNEAKEVSKEKKKQLNESREDDKWEGPNLPREDFYKLAKQIADLLKQDGGITPESIERAGGDPAEYAKIRDLKVKDTNMDGTANVSDVVAANKLDAADGVPNTKIGPRFTNPLAAQARLEMGHGVEGDEELAGKLEPEVDVDDEDYWRRTMMPDEDTVVRESINNKISKMLRESEDEDDPAFLRRSGRSGAGFRAVRPKSTNQNPDIDVPRGGMVMPGGVNWDALVDIFHNPHKYPVHIAKAVQDSFSDIFSKGEGLKDKDFYYGED